MSPTARSREMDSAPEPTPASTTRAPGKMSAMVTIWRGVLGVDDGGAARHGEHEVGQQRTQRLVLLAHVVDHDGAVRQADDVVMRQEPPVRVEGTSRRRA